MSKHANGLLENVLGESDVDLGAEGATFSWPFLLRIGIRLLFWVLTVVGCLSWAPYLTHSRADSSPDIGAVTNVVIPLIQQTVQSQMKDNIRESVDRTWERIDQSHFATEEEVKEVRDKQDQLLNKIDQMEINIATLVERSKHIAIAPHEEK